MPLPLGVMDAPWPAASALPGIPQPREGLGGIGTQACGSMISSPIQACWRKTPHGSPPAPLHAPDATLCGHGRYPWGPFRVQACRCDGLVRLHTDLCLRGNRPTRLPLAWSQLARRRMLDPSRNQLTVFPRVRPTRQPETAMAARQPDDRPSAARVGSADPPGITGCASHPTDWLSFPVLAPKPE